MPPKKSKEKDRSASATALTPRQFESSMQLLLPSSLQITDGAMEALRLAHSEFLNLVASELASNKECLEKLVQPNDVQESLNRLGYQEFNVEEEEESRADSAYSSSSKQRKKKKGKRFAVSQDMVAEQERLLEESRVRAVQAAKENRKDGS